MRALKIWAAAVLSLSISFTLAEDYRLSVAPEDLTNGRALLGQFEGEVAKIDTVEKGKPKNTVGFKVDGDREKGNTLWGECESGNFTVKRFGFPYRALVFVLPEDGDFPSTGDVKDAAKRCMQKEIPNIGSAPRIKSSRKKLYRAGEEVARLYLVSFERMGRDPYLDMPRRIGSPPKR